MTLMIGGESKEAVISFQNVYTHCFLRYFKGLC